MYWLIRNQCNSESLNWRFSIHLSAEDYLILTSLKIFIVRISRPQETYALLSTKWQKYLKNLLDVSSSQFSWQSSSYPSANGASAFLDNRPYHWGTDHSGWSCDNRCTTRRLYKARHSLLCIYRYHDPWWKMTYHDDVDQVHHQQFLQKGGKANYRSYISRFSFAEVFNRSISLVHKQS